MRPEILKLLFVFLLKVELINPINKSLAILVLKCWLKIWLVLQNSLVRWKNFFFEKSILQNENITKVFYVV